MYLKRQAASTKLPIKRKGTKYVARALSHVNESVPVVIAVRDMLKLARTTREVKQMINKGLLKINWRPVHDERESIKLFNILEADKVYYLTLLRTGKFVLKELNKDENRLCKVVEKRLVKSGKIQLNLHDGSNVITDKNKIVTGDLIHLDKEGNMVNHVPLDKGRQVFIIKGRHLGQSGVINSISKREILVKLEDGGIVTLTKEVLFVLR